MTNCSVYPRWNSTVVYWLYSWRIWNDRSAILYIYIYIIFVKTLRKVVHLHIFIYCCLANKMWDLGSSLMMYSCEALVIVEGLQKAWQVWIESMQLCTISLKQCGIRKCLTRMIKFGTQQAEDLRNPKPSCSRGKTDLFLIRHLYYIDKSTCLLWLWGHSAEHLSI
jgi:hypothetical protein